MEAECVKFLNYQQNDVIECGVLREPDKILSLKSILGYLGHDISLVDSDTNFYNNYSTLKPVLEAFLEKNAQKVHLFANCGYGLESRRYGSRQGGC